MAENITESKDKLPSFFQSGNDKTNNDHPLRRQNLKKKKKPGKCSKTVPKVIRYIVFPLKLIYLVLLPNMKLKTKRPAIWRFILNLIFIPVLIAGLNFAIFYFEHHTIRAFDMPSFYYSSSFKVFMNNLASIGYFLSFSGRWANSGYSFVSSF